MPIVQCEHINSSSYGKTSITCTVDTDTKKYELHYDSQWLNMTNPVNYNITGDLIYVDYNNNPFTFHAYLSSKPKDDSYMTAIIEIISFPKLRECVVGTRDHDKYCMTNSTDVFDVNGIILAEVCQDVDELSHEVELVKTLNGCSLKIYEP